MPLLRQEKDEASLLPVAEGPQNAFILRSSGREGFFIFRPELVSKRKPPCRGKAGKASSKNV